MRVHTCFAHAHAQVRHLLNEERAEAISATKKHAEAIFAAEERLRTATEQGAAEQSAALQRREDQLCNEFQQMLEQGRQAAERNEVEHELALKVQELELSEALEASLDKMEAEHREALEQAVAGARGAAATELEALHAEYCERIDALKAEMAELAKGHEASLAAAAEAHKAEMDRANRAQLAVSRQAEQSGAEKDEELTRLRWEVAELEKTVTRLKPSRPE